MQSRGDWTQSWGEPVEEECFPDWQSFIHTFWDLKKIYNPAHKIYIKNKMDKVLNADEKSRN